MDLLYDQCFEADHLSKPLKTLNIRHPKKLGNTRSTGTCCPPIQKTQAIRCSNSLKFRCLIQESNPRLQANKRCWRIVINALQPLNCPILHNGLPGHSLPGEEVGQTCSSWIQKNCNCQEQCFSAWKVKMGQRVHVHMFQFILKRERFENIDITLSIRLSFLCLDSQQSPIVSYEEMKVIIQTCKAPGSWKFSIFVN